MALAEERLLAFRQHFHAEFRYVWTSLRRLGVHARDLEDVTHDVFVEVHRHFERYDPARPIRPWLFAFALRFASDYRKQARLRREVWGDPPEAVDEAPLAPQRMEEEERRALVAEALETLELDRRSVFILFEIDEFPMNEIASSLGIPVNTAYSRLRLAREDFGVAVRRLRLRKTGER